MRKSLSLVVLLGLAGGLAVLPSKAQVTGGHETEQDAIRFEREKDAAAARQARIESRDRENSSADRSTTDTNKTDSGKQRKSRSGSADRSTPKSTDQQKQ